MSLNELLIERAKDHDRELSHPQKLRRAVRKLQEEIALAKEPDPLYKVKRYLTRTPFFDLVKEAIDIVPPVATVDVNVFKTPDGNFLLRFVLSWGVLLGFENNRRRYGLIVDFPSSADKVAVVAGQFDIPEGAPLDVSQSMPIITENMIGERYAGLFTDGEFAHPKIMATIFADALAKAEVKPSNKD